MKILVVGASRGVGLEVVRLALERGWEVTAVARTTGALEIAHPLLKVALCDVQLQPERFSALVAGQDAVLCTLGASRRGKTTLYSDGALAIARAMREQRVRRLVFLSNFGILNEKAETLGGKLVLKLLKWVVPHTLADHRNALEILRAQVPEWIAVRPVPLTNGGRAAAIEVSVDGMPIGLSVSRADVAAFMLDQAVSDVYVGKAPAIAARQVRATGFRAGP